MSVRATKEVLVVRQLKEMSILLRRGEIPRLYCLLLGQPNRKRVYQSRT